jgi:signal transduction histidine kinase
MDGTTMVKFVIVGVRRTGTTLIRTTLDSHPHVRCFGASFRHGRRLTNSQGENFETGYQQYLRASPVRRLQDLLLPALPVHAYLDELFAPGEHKAVGFKLLDYEFRQYPIIMQYLRQQDARVIQVVRKNVLKTLISRSVKKVRRFGKATESVARTQITLRADRLVKDLERIEQANEQWPHETQGMPYLRTTYEDFVADKAHELRRMLDFLDVEFIDNLQSPLIKVNPDDIRQIITNYDQVEVALKGTRYEWCLQA